MLEGWIKKTNFLEEGKDPIQATIRLEVAWLNASRFFANGIREYSQWFCRAKNNVANALSRDNNQSGRELMNILHTKCPSQIPKQFEIVPVPRKIV